MFISERRSDYKTLQIEESKNSNQKTFLKWYCHIRTEFITLIFLCSCGTNKEVVLSHQTMNEEIVEHSPIVFLVMYNAEIGKEPLQKAIKEYGCEVIYDYHSINGMALRKPDGRALEETMQYFKKTPPQQ